MVVHLITRKRISISKPNINCHQAGYQQDDTTNETASNNSPFMSSFFRGIAKIRYHQLACLSLEQSSGNEQFIIDASSKMFLLINCDHNQVNFMIFNTKDQCIGSMSARGVASSSHHLTNLFGLRFTSFNIVIQSSSAVCETSGFCPKARKYRFSRL